MSQMMSQVHSNTFHHGLTAAVRLINHITNLNFSTVEYSTVMHLNSAVPKSFRFISSLCGNVNIIYSIIYI